MSGEKSSKMYRPTPVVDGLVSRSSLLAIPPSLTNEICDRVIEEFQKAAKKHM